MENLRSNPESGSQRISGPNSGSAGQGTGNYSTGSPASGEGNYGTENSGSGKGSYGTGDSAPGKNTSTGRPAWMSDPLVKEIPAKKLQFLEQLFAQGQGKSQKELMAFFMPAMKKARQENLTFTPQEVSAAIAAIKKYSSAEELKKIDKILEKSKQGGK